ncbi:hypothetical protein [Gimesia maris]|uniref:Formate dehydrogenase accessory protein FdhE n=1 Tax=Gimesia maris TaxID=122 RepID=A0ABX5YP37_9PLAN|nr:hypothetical protein [Gimesia maris]EDL62272.1 hypothetical protein PM8797T_28129 [Gimesia maris DSM 8797]QEG17325.1 hypothetical protein GmarT_32050 [Gimesia maris]QGQ29580.1 hypothetical protein F1729_13475 [Gimesia maris]
MITSKLLERSLKAAIIEANKVDDSLQKRALLQSLFESLNKELVTLVTKSHAEKMLSAWLSKRNEFPLAASRLVISDLDRLVKCVTWGQKDSAIAGVIEIIKLAITVRAGDCNKCLGEELIYMWDKKSNKVICQCDLCDNKQDLNGNIISEETVQCVPTSFQLFTMGLINDLNSPP